MLRSVLMIVGRGGEGECGHARVVNSGLHVAITHRQCRHILLGAPAAVHLFFL